MSAVRDPSGVAPPREAAARSKAGRPELRAGSADPTQHEIRVVDGQFTRATCSCGWTGAGRRSRANARQEAHDHALLYVAGTALDVNALGMDAVDLRD